MIVEVNLQNGSNNIEVGLNNNFIPVTLTDSEMDNFNIFMPQILGYDVTNMGWLVNITGTSPTIPMKFNSSLVENVTTYCDKGIVIASEDLPTGTTEVENLVGSLINRMLTDNSGNIKFWFIIKRLDLSNFSVEVAIYDILNQVEFLDVIFTNYTSAAPIPTELNLNNPIIISPNVKVFSMNTLTFEDPENVVGETYEVTIDFKDDLAQSIDFVETSVVIQDI